MTASVTVVIPTYNRRATVGRAVESVLAQTARPAEIIVVDDGSRDGSAEMLVERHGAAIRVIEQANAGAAAARNAGVLNASGMLVAFLDSDDVWDPGKLAAQLDALSGSPAVLNYTNYRRGPGRDEFAEIGLVLAEPCTSFERPLELLTRWRGAGIHLSGTLVARQALLDAGLFDPGMRIAEDTKLFLALAGRGAFSVLRRPFWSRNEAVDGVALTVRVDEAYQREQAHAVVPLLEALFAEEKGNRIVRRNLRHLLAHFSMKQAKFHARDGRFAEARRQAARSLAYAPFARSALRAALIACAPAVASQVMGSARGRAVPNGGPSR